MAILRDFKYHAPKTMPEALRLLSDSESPMLLAGGTFVLNYLKKAARYPTDLIGLKEIKPLKGIGLSKEGLSIGAMTTISELIDSGLIAKHFPSFSEACRKMATTPIRNMATLGGNLSSRFFWVDLPTVLIALKAKVTLRTSKKKETVGLEDFLAAKPLKRFIMTDIFLPHRDLLGFYFRHTKTMEVDAPSLGLAFSAFLDKTRLREARVIVNTASSFPVAFKNTEDIFEGREPGEIDLREVREAMRQDAAKTKLDEYRVWCLELDLEDLVRRLKGSAR